MQIVHVQNHKELSCHICSEWLKIERYDRHMENHQRETSVTQSDNSVPKIPKPTKTPKQSNPTIPSSELLFCHNCQMEFLASNEKGLQEHIKRKHQEKNTPKSSEPKIKKKPPTKAQVEISNRELILDNLQLTTQLKYGFF